MAAVKHILKLMGPTPHSSLMRPRIYLSPPDRLSPLLTLARRRFIAAAESLPRAIQPSLWQSMVPKAFRQPKQQSNKSKRERKKEWNPATFFIIISLLIGSNGIQMISLRNDFMSFSTKADAKIALLKEVIERVQKGEDVDVEGLLGTGDKEKEKEWEEVFREIQAGDPLWKPGTSRRKDRPGPRTTSMGSSDTNLHDRTDLPANEASTNKSTVATNVDTSEPVNQTPTIPRRGPRGFF